MSEHLIQTGRAARAVRARWLCACLATTTVIALFASPANAGEVLDLANLAIPVVLGDQPEEQFGYSLAIGDVDGDGEAEILVGAPGHVSREGGEHEGAVYVMARSRIAELAEAAQTHAIADAVLECRRDRARFGSTLAVGDINGDGTSDVVIGAPDDGTDEHRACGRVYVILGRPDLASVLDAAEAAKLILTGDETDDRLGSSIVLRDVDSDGLADLLVTACRAGNGPGPGPGKAYLVGGEDLIGLDGERRVSELSRMTFVGDSPGDALRGIVPVDADGDGAYELLIGAMNADGPKNERTDAGEIYVVPLTAAHTSESRVSDAAVSTIYGAREGGFLGRAIATGNIDSDGLVDLLIPAYAAGGSGKNLTARGEAYVIFGGAGGFGDSIDIAASDLPTFTGSGEGRLFGLPVLLEDLNGDSSDDLVIASQFAGSPDGSRLWCGEVYIFWGGLRSVMAAKAGSAALADVTIVGPRSSDAIGGSLMAADITGNQRPDIVIGAPDATGSTPGSRRAGKVMLVPSTLFLP